MFFSLDRNDLVGAAWWWSTMAASHSTPATALLSASSRRGGSLSANGSCSCVPLGHCIFETGKKGWFIVFYPIAALPTNLEWQMDPDTELNTCMYYSLRKTTDGWRTLHYTQTGWADIQYCVLQSTQSNANNL